MNELGNTPADKDYKPSGISKAEEAALKAYPEELTTAYGPLPGASAPCIFDGNQPYRIGFKRGYEAAEKDLGWISVKDRLPGPSEWVVACIEQHRHSQCLTLATYNEETKEWHTDNWEDGEQETYNPDYWMPIPNRIKGAKE